jgi:transaldolase
VAIAKKSWISSPRAGINVNEVAAQLRDEGAKSFVKSWNDLMGVIAFKSAALRKVN